MTLYTLEWAKLKASKILWNLSSKPLCKMRVSPNFIKSMISRWFRESTPTTSLGKSEVSMIGSAKILICATLQSMNIIMINPNVRFKITISHRWSNISNKLLKIMKWVSWKQMLSWNLSALMKMNFVFMKVTLVFKHSSKSSKTGFIIKLQMI